MTNDIQIADFLKSAQVLIRAGFAQASESDPVDAKALEGVIRAGGLISAKATFTVSGLAQLAIHITEPNGIEHQLMSLSLEANTHRRA